MSGANIAIIAVCVLLVLLLVAAGFVALRYNKQKEGDHGGGGGAPTMSNIVFGEQHKPRPATPGPGVSAEDEFSISNMTVHWPGLNPLANKAGAGSAANYKGAASINSSSNGGDGFEPTLQGIQALIAAEVAKASGNPTFAAAGTAEHAIDGGTTTVEVDAWAPGDLDEGDGDGSGVLPGAVQGDSNDVASPRPELSVSPASPRPSPEQRRQLTAGGGARGPAAGQNSSHNNMETSLQDMIRGELAKMTMDDLQIGLQRGGDGNPLMPLPPSHYYPQAFNVHAPTQQQNAGSGVNFAFARRQQNDGGQGLFSSAPATPHPHLHPQPQPYTQQPYTQAGFAPPPGMVMGAHAYSQGGGGNGHAPVPTAMPQRAAGWSPPHPQPDTAWPTIHRVDSVPGLVSTDPNPFESFSVEQIQNANMKINGLYQRVQDGRDGYLDMNTAPPQTETNMSVKDEDMSPSGPRPATPLTAQFAENAQRVQSLTGRDPRRIAQMVVLLTRTALTASYGFRIGNDAAGDEGLNIVTHVTPAGCAQGVLEAGDRVLSINGEALTDSSQDAVSRMIQGTISLQVRIERKLG